MAAKQERSERVILTESEEESASIDLEGLLEDSEPVAGGPQKIDGVIIGRITAFDASGEALIDFPANPAGKAIPARSLSILGKHMIGREAALLFEGGNPRRPLIVGLIVSSQTPQKFSKHQAQTLDIEADGQQVTLQAKRELTLRCGKASITLTKDGKILIRGTYILSRSTGANHIKGGSVQLN